jgi:trigger factor
MQVTRDKTENNQVFLTIEMEPAEVEASLDRSYKRLVKKTNIPGFRKGKATRAVLERYIGKEKLLEDALNEMLPQAYEKAIKEQEIDAFAQPDIEVTQTNPLIFKATVPLPPVVELGDYSGVRVKPETIEVKDDDVKATIEQLQHQHATWEPVERPVNFSDMVFMDVESAIGDTPFINQKGAQYQVIKDSAFPAPGFAGQIVGMGRDAEKEFKLKFPADFANADLAGKEASFKVKVTEVKEERLPELNDEFAQEIGPAFKTMDSLRDIISADLKSRAEERTRINFEERVVEAVIELSRVEFPPILVEVEIDRLINQQLQYWQAGNRGLDEYLKMINKTEGELREEMRPLATKRATQSLVLGEVAEAEKIEVSDAEIDDEIKNMVKGGTDDESKLKEYLSNPQARQSVRGMLTTRKALQKLTEIAKGPAGARSKKREKK